MADDVPPVKRRRTIEESDTDDEDKPLGKDAVREQVVQSFISKTINVRTQEGKLLLYLHDDSVSIIQDVLEDLQQNSNVADTGELSTSFVWNAINLQLVAIAQLRLLYGRLGEMQRQQDIYSVLGVMRTKIESLKGVEVAQLLMTSGDELWQEFQKHKCDSLQWQARKAQLRKRAANMLHAYHLEALCGVAEFRQWARSAYQHNPFEFFNRIGSISQLLRKQLITHLDLTDVPIYCSYAAGHLAVVIKYSDGLTTSGGLWGCMHASFQKHGFLFVSYHDERMKTVCDQAVAQGLPVFTTRKSFRPDRFNKYRPVAPSEQWVAAYLSNIEVFPAQRSLREETAVRLQAAVVKAAEAVLQDVLPQQRREVLKVMKGVMLLAEMPCDRHFGSIQHGLQSQGIAMVCAPSELLPLYKAFLPSDVLIDRREATYEDLGIKHQSLRGLNLEWIAALRRSAAPASADLPKLLTAFTSISAAEESISEIVVNSTSEAKRRIEANGEEPYFRMDITLPFSMEEIPITSLSFSSTAKNARHRFEQKLIANVKLTMTDEGGRLQCQQFGRMAMGKCNDISDSDLLCHALQVLRKEDKVVLLCFDAPDDSVYASHPLKRSDFPKVFLFKSVPHTPMQLEEYMACIAYFMAIVRRRLVQKQETKVWLLGKNARSFAKSLPFAAATWSEVIVEQQLKKLLDPDDSNVIEKCIACLGKDAEVPAVLREQTQFLPKDFCLDISIPEQQRLFLRIDAACTDLLELDQQFPRSVPAEYPEKFMLELDELPSLTLLQWVLVRLVPMNDGYNGGPTWTTKKIKKAEALYSKIRRTSLAYHASAMAVARGLPSLLNVEFESLAEVEATVERLAQRIHVLNLRPPWRDEPMWGASKHVSPDALIKTFRNSAVKCNPLKCRHGGPAAGYEAKFVKSHYLEGSHIRYLYQTYFTTQWEAPPILYGIIFHHAVRSK